MVVGGGWAMEWVPLLSPNAHPIFSPALFSVAILRAIVAANVKMCRGRLAALVKEMEECVCKKLGFYMMRRRWIVATCSVIWPALILVSLIYCKTALDQNGGLGTVGTTSQKGSVDHSSSTNSKLKDKLVDGLESADFREKSCSSRPKRLVSGKGNCFPSLRPVPFPPFQSSLGANNKILSCYLAKADERIGIQVRDFKSTNLPFQSLKDHIASYYLPHLIVNESIFNRINNSYDVTSPLSYMMDRILNCSVKKNLLPKLKPMTNPQESISVGTWRI
ncbi:unnamed protein product [Camellia sinensis]